MLLSRGFFVGKRARWRAAGKLLHPSPMASLSSAMAFFSTRDT